MFPGASGRPTEYSAASSSCSIAGWDVPQPLNVFPFQISAMSGDHAVKVVDLVSTDDEAEPTSSDEFELVNNSVEMMDESSLTPGLCGCWTLWPLTGSWRDVQSRVEFRYLCELPAPYCCANGGGPWVCPSACLKPVLPAVVVGLEISYVISLV